MTADLHVRIVVDPIYADRAIALAEARLAELQTEEALERSREELAGLLEGFSGVTRAVADSVVASMGRFVAIGSAIATSAFAQEYATELAGLRGTTAGEELGRAYEEAVRSPCSTLEILERNLERERAGL